MEVMEPLEVRPLLEEYITGVGMGKVLRIDSVSSLLVLSLYFPHRYENMASHLSILITMLSSTVAMPFHPATMLGLWNCKPKPILPSINCFWL